MSTQPWSFVCVVSDFLRPRRNCLHSLINAIVLLQIPRAFGQVRARAKGTGYAMLQMDYNQNTEKTWQVSGPEFTSYDVEVANIAYSGHNSSIMDMTLCTRSDIIRFSGFWFLYLADFDITLL